LTIEFTHTQIRFFEPGACKQYSLIYIVRLSSV